MSFLKNSSIGLRLGIMVGVLLTLLAGSGAISIIGTGSVAVSLRTVYQDRTVPLTYLTNLLDGFHKIRLTVLSLLQADDPATIEKLAAEVRDIDAAVDRDISALIGTHQPPE